MVDLDEATSRQEPRVEQPQDLDLAHGDAPSSDSQSHAQWGKVSSSLQPSDSTHPNQASMYPSPSEDPAEIAPWYSYSASTLHQNLDAPTPVQRPRRSTRGDCEDPLEISNENEFENDAENGGESANCYGNANASQAEMHEKSLARNSGRHVQFPREPVEVFPTRQSVRIKSRRTNMQALNIDRD
ncbi:hypothetical protein Ae201684P_003284 [Aphanomyces euteiches]|nr:hypothetical protein Ae201684P_003284 [Aphanomyces euteiches]